MTKKHILYIAIVLMILGVVPALAGSGDIAADRKAVAAIVSSEKGAHDVEVIIDGSTALAFYAVRGDKRSPTARRVVAYFGKGGGQWRLISRESAATGTAPIPVSAEVRAFILAARENVWRSWFRADLPALNAAIPKEIIAINTGGGDLTHYDDVITSAKQFVESGSKLIRLEYPKDEIQIYGSMVIIYTAFVFEIESKGERRTVSGRATDMFLIRDGNFVNVGWHLDSGK